MPENNQSQYELDHDYAPLGIVDAADGSGTTWPEFVGQVNKMDNQVAALTEDRYSRFHTEEVVLTFPAISSYGGHSENYEVPAVEGYEPIGIVEWSAMLSPYVLPNNIKLGNISVVNVFNSKQNSSGIRLKILYAKA